MSDSDQTLPPQGSGPQTNGHLTEEKAADDSQAKGKASQAKLNAADHKGQNDRKNKNHDEKQEEPPPPGGFDNTPVPAAAPGFTMRFTFHRAANLPIADINAMSSDPFITAELITDLPTRHREDPRFLFRTPTIRKSTNPEWNCTWVVGNVPASGFLLKARIYDEDPADHDDRLGNVRVLASGIDESWPGIHEQSYKIKKRMGSKRAYLVTGCAAIFGRGMHLSGQLVISAEVLGRTEAPGGRLYTIGPQYWTQHYSPMIGRLAGVKEPGPVGKTEHYNFQANQIQLQGPVPCHLYHRYVEFKPFVKAMFSQKGVRGHILHMALHHQHARIYNFDRATIYGCLPEPSEQLTLQFLSMVHFDQGGRIFTYVLTLDGMFRFTETGKEFGIDLLSKHTMHSDVSIYTAFSGEFFVRRLRYGDRDVNDSEQVSHPPNPVEGGPPEEAPPKDVTRYELVIDNDSGTYRPNGDYLSQLGELFQRNFPGLHIRTLRCTDEHLDKMKDEQKANKKTEGREGTFAQDDGGSISSSDEDALNARATAASLDANAKKSRGRGGKTGGALSQGLKLVAEPGEFVHDWTQGDKAREQREEADDAAANRGG
ncbi:MAG: hypothetical protein M1838_004459 [Thelocarpon superellum]|nr:MAG: hypothetical protein M1838_004459 [Thelocarpon superellum]